MKLKREYILVAHKGKLLEVVYSNKLVIKCLGAEGKICF